MNEISSHPRMSTTATAVWIAVNIMLAVVLAACIRWSEPEAIAATLLMLVLVNMLAFFVRRQWRANEPSVRRSLIQKSIGYLFFCAGAFGWKLLFDYKDGLGYAFLFATVSTSLYILAEFLLGYWSSSSGKRPGL